MLGAVFRGPGEIGVEEIETPGVGPGELLIKIGANTVCGTDVRILRGEKTKGIVRGTVLGHEISGVVAEAGSGVEGFGEGDAVAVAPILYCGRCYYCRNDLENLCANPRVIGYDVHGGLAEYVRLPAEAVANGNVFAASGDIPLEQLALAEPLACCVNGHNRTGVGVDDVVIIMGAGPIGLFHAQLALLAGARTVIVSEPSQARRDFATKLGAHLTVNPMEEDLAEAVAEATGGIGVDAAFICIGVPALVNEAFRLARKGGRVNVFAGLAGAGWAEVEANLIHYNELEVTGSANSRRRDYGMAMRLIESGRVRVDEMVTHRFPLAEAIEAIETSAGGEGIKVAVMP